MQEQLILSTEEKKAIAALKRLSKTWPSTLWLYSASGSLCVMKKDENGEIPMTGIGGVDPNFKVAKVAIENDGGDW